MAYHGFVGGWREKLQRAITAPDPDGGVDFNNVLHLINLDTTPDSGGGIAPDNTGRIPGNPRNDIVPKGGLPIDTNTPPPGLAVTPPPITTPPPATTPPPGTTDDFGRLVDLFKTIFGNQQVSIPVQGDPTLVPTTSSSPLPLALIAGGLAVGGWYYYKHRKGRT